jgi:hypothetical protein
MKINLFEENSMIITKMTRRYTKFAKFEHGTVALISRDGLVYKFKHDDIVKKLDGLPHDEHGWFFNETRDRYCAEAYYDLIEVNPSMIEKLFPGQKISYTEIPLGLSRF